MTMVKRLVALVATVLSAAALIAVAGAWLVRLPAVEDTLRDRVVGAIMEGADGLGARIGHLQVTGLRTVVAEQVEIRVDGRRFLRVPRVTATLSLRALLGRRLAFARIVVARPDVRVERTSAGWRLPRAHPTTDGASTAVRIDRIDVLDGRLVIDRRRALTAIEVTGALNVTPAGLQVDVERASGVPRGIDIGPTIVGGVVSVASDGTLRAERVSLVTPRSRLSAEGTLAVDDAASALRVTADPLAAADVRAAYPAMALEADVRGSLRIGGTGDRPQLRFAADLQDGGRVRAAARVRRAASGVGPWRLRAAFAALDPGAIAGGLPRAHAGGRLSAAGRGLDLRHDAIDWTLGLSSSQLAGQTVDRATVRGHGTIRVHHVAARVESPDGSLRGRGAVAEARRPRYRAAANVHVERLAALISALAGRGDARISVRGTGIDPTDRRADARVHLRTLDVQGIAFTAGTIEAHLVGTQLEVPTVVLDGPALHAEGTASVELGRRAIVASASARGDLHTLVPGLAGQAVVSATARGPVDDLQVSARGRVEGGEWSGTTFRRVDGAFDARGVGGPRENATVQFDVAEARRGGTSLDARGGGSVRRDGTRLAGTLDTLALRPATSGAWTLARPARFVLDEGVTLEGLVLSSGAQRVTLDGRAARRGRAEAHLTLAAVAVADLCAATGGASCGGVLSGMVRLGGTAESPEVAADLDVERLAASDVRYGDLHLRATYARCLTSLRSSITHAAASDVRIEGTWPMDLAWAGPACDLRGRGLAVDLHAARVDLAGLRAMAPNDIRSVAGTLSADLRLRGTPATLAASGDVTIDHGRLELFGAGVPWQDIRIHLVASGDRIDVTELSARGGNGTLEGTGRIALAGLAPDALAVDVRLTDFLAARQGGYEGTLAGTLEVRGTADAPRITGSLTVPRLVIPTRSAPGGRARTRSRSDDRGGGDGGAAAEIAHRGPDRGRRAVARDRSHAGRRRVDAATRCQRPARGGGAPRQGRARATRNNRDAAAPARNLRLPGAPVHVDRGEIVLPPGQNAEPALDVTATYRVGGYFVTVQVNGPIDRPTLTLSSDPPLEQADILAVLLFGRPTTTLGPTEATALQRETVQLAAGYAAPELSSSVRDALGLDLLDVSMPEGATTPGEVKVGRYVTDDVFVTLAQEFGPRLAQIVGLEYHLRRNLSVRLSTSTRGASAVDVFWHRRY